MTVREWHPVMDSSRVCSMLAASALPISAHQYLVCRRSLRFQDDFKEQETNHQSIHPSIHQKFLFLLFSQFKKNINNIETQFN